MRPSDFVQLSFASLAPCQEQADDESLLLCSSDASQSKGQSVGALQKRSNTRVQRRCCGAAVSSSFSPTSIRPPSSGRPGWQRWLPLSEHVKVGATSGSPHCGNTAPPPKKWQFFHARTKNKKMRAQRACGAQRRPAAPPGAVGARALRGGSKER